MADLATNALAFEGSEDSGGGLSSFETSANLTPVASTLFYVYVAVHSDSGAWTGSPTLTGGGMSSWTLADSKVEANVNQIYAFRAVDASPGAAATLVFTAPGAETFDTVAVTAVKVVSTTVSGTNGADAQIQEDEASAAGGVANALTVTFGSVMTAGNSALAVVAMYGTTTGSPSVPSSGWSELEDDEIIGSGARQISLAVAWRADSDTSVTFTKDGSASTAGGKCGLLFEIEVAVAASGASTGRATNRANNRATGRAG